MMRYLLIFLLSCTSAFGYTKNAGTKEYWTDASFGDVTNAFQNLKDTVTEDDWSIVVGGPSATATWASSYNFTGHAYDWILKGTNATSKPTITLTASQTITGDGSAGNIPQVQNIIWETSSALDPMITLTGDGDANNYIFGPGNQMQNDGTGSARSLFCRAYGLVFSNRFLGDSENKIWSTDINNQWSGHMTWGSTSNVVIEDNVFGNTSTTMSQAFDGDRGMRIIFRFNTLTNSNNEGHGETSGVGNESLQMEVYKNNHWMQGTGINGANWIFTAVRGGTAYVYSNDCQQASGSTWGDHNWRHRMWTEQAASYLADYQPGTGLVSLDTIGSMPVYFWDNTAWESALNGEVQETEDGGSTVTLNTDYFIDSTPSGYLDNTLAYPHPLRSEGSPAAGTRVSTGGKITTTGKIGIQ